MNLAVRYEDDAADRRHVPVMVEEVCGLLSAHGPLAFVDVTVGTGGHAEAMLRASKARMLGLDRDASRATGWGSSAIAWCWSALTSAKLRP
jgi:16S rRNA C1402 N4-methylase RsmH